jgi:catalase
MSDDVLAKEVIDAIALVDAPFPTRALHAKGTLCAATFTPTPQARELSRAAHFAGPAVSAHVRFSNGGSNPDGVDNAPREGRGMAVKFTLPDGTKTDIVAVTLPAFFVRTPEDFLEFVRARTPDPSTGEPDPDRIGAFVGDHPEALTALMAVVGGEPPASYLQCRYNALHAYVFVDAAGTRQSVRYHLVPADGVRTVSAEEYPNLDSHYLRDDLRDRLAAGSASFSLLATLGAADDPLDDPTAVWPDDRPQVDLGRLEITGLAFDRETDGDVLVFDPTRVTDGIELTDDPILRFRAVAYAESVRRRM